MGQFEDTVSALCYTLAGRHCDERGGLRMPPYNDLVRFVLGQHAKMSGLLRLPVRFATLSLSLYALVTRGSRFHRLDVARRVRVVEIWRQSWIPAFRDLIRFYESLVVIALYSRSARWPNEGAGKT